MAVSMNHFIRLIIAFMAAIATAFAQDAPPGADSCAEGHFIVTCAYAGLKFVNNELGMYCLNDNTEIFGYNWTWVDLNKCVTNQDGQLVASTTGGYTGSCFNCEVSNVTAHLTCDCWDRMATKRDPTSIDLNTVIYNVDGAMGCCDQMGNKTWKGPQVPAKH